MALYVQLMGASGAGKSVTMSQPWLWSRVGESRNWFNERAEDTDCTLMQDQYLNTVAPSMDAEEQQDSIRATRPDEESAHLNRTAPAQRHAMGTYRGIKPVDYNPDTQTPPDLARYIEANSDAAVTDPLVHTKRITTTTEDEDGNTTEETKEVTALKPRAVALARYDEMGKVFTKNGSSPILDELAKAWSGSPLGGTTQGHGNKQVSGLYSYNLEGGVQPSLLSEFATPAAMRGFMQRQIFCYALWPFGDLDISITPQETLPPSPLETTPDLDAVTAVPAVAHAVRSRALNGELVNDVNKDEESIWLRGVPEHVRAMMSHTTLIAVRLACAVAALHGVSHVSEAIWSHTLDLMQFHRRSLRAFVAQGDAAAAADRTHAGTLAGVADMARDRHKKEAADTATKHRTAVLKMLNRKRNMGARVMNHARMHAWHRVLCAPRRSATRTSRSGPYPSRGNPNARSRGAMRYMIPHTSKGNSTTA